MNKLDIQYRFIMVDERPVCIWDLDINKRTLHFLDSIDPAYFEYVANVNLDNVLESDEQTSDTRIQQHAALALRSAYSQALETLFALLCATIQASNCIPAWITSYQNIELRNVVVKIDRHQPILSRLNSKSISWSDISELIFASLVLDDKEKESGIKKDFANLWARFASEFLEKNFTEEYNSIKHGLRVRSGGFSLAIGHEDKPGVPAPKEKMQLIGKSDYGTSFIARKKIGKFAHHIYFERGHRNWNPEDLAWGLKLISMSISNIQSALRILNGLPAENVRFAWPSDNSVFAEPWKRSRQIGVTLMRGFDVVISPEMIDPIQQDSIRADYEAGKGGGTKRIYFKDTNDKKDTEASYQ